MAKWVVYAIISMLFAGITSVVAKFGMKGLSSDVALTVRTCVVFIFVVINAFVFKNAFIELQNVSANNLAFLALSGLTTAISWIFYYRAMKIGPVSYVASIDKASIVVTILLSFIILKEPVTARVLAGAGFILTGLIILIWK